MHNSPSVPRAIMQWRAIWLPWRANTYSEMAVKITFLEWSLNKNWWRHTARYNNVITGSFREKWTGKPTIQPESTFQWAKMYLKEVLKTHPQDWSSRRALRLKNLYVFPENVVGISLRRISFPITLRHVTIVLTALPYPLIDEALCGRVAAMGRGTEYQTPKAISHNGNIVESVERWKQIE